MLIGSVGLNSIANTVSSQGFNSAHRASNQAKRNLSVSNFGGETKIGSSKFQKANESVSNDGERATAKNMHDVQSSIKQFEHKQSYTKNATLSAIRQSTLEVNM